MSAPTVLMVSWRDTRNPEAGGSEVYIERIAQGLVRRGYDVTILCRRYPGSARTEMLDGVRFRRRGNRYTVYLWALLSLLRSRQDVVVDVQNGMPFFSRLVTRSPVVLLVHHLHRQQWRSWFGPVLGPLGWWVESRISPLVYRKCRYVTVSEHTRTELTSLGVAAERVAVVPNGFEPVPDVPPQRSAEPMLVVVSRLVPHKRLEHAVEAVARLSHRWPDLRLEIVGRGPSDVALRQLATERGVADRVVLHGWVDEQAKHEILARAWLHLCPSQKEGWGISVMEAAAHGVATVAYRSAGGVCESVRHGTTGLLAGDGEGPGGNVDEFVTQVERLLADPRLREAMGQAGRAYARSFDWERSADAFEEVLCEATGLRPSNARAALIPHQRRAPSTVQHPAQVQRWP
ncbi:MAG TPA: glycosyltransferase family 4 protein [Rugosimonospora sp.]|nr:glycosyltransferase family 4 protein [Rugosimonospora sp.]